MKRTPKLAMSRLVPLLALAASSVVATTQSSVAASDETFSVDDNFRHGWHEATVGSAVYFSDVIRRFDHPDVNYWAGYAQLAYTMTSPGGEGFFRGSFQLAPEVFGAGIFHGPGSYVAGATIWFRYNFVQPGWRFVPYVAGGGGGTFLDIPHQFDGKDFNFNLDLAAGARYFVTQHCSLNAEYRFQHISNANLWSRNVGLNTTGPALSVSFFF
jgi:hypothetical protein